MKKLSIKAVGAAAALLIAGALFYGPELQPGKPAVQYMAAVGALMAILWITEAIPLAVTSLIPLFLFPALGLLSGDKTAESYINSTIFLFLGGFILALVMEKWHLHKRVALSIILFTGSSPDRIILGFLLSCALISMWISNTATAMMLLPVGLAVVKQMQQECGTEETRNFSTGVMLAIAYGSSIGGVMTLIGTAPNLSFVRIMHIIFPAAPEIAFGAWMQMMFPLGCALLFAAWLLITKLLFRNSTVPRVDIQVIRVERAALGAPSFEEKTIGAVFLVTVLLWIFRTEMNLGFAVVPGWSRLFPQPGYITDGAIAMFAAFVLFLIPPRAGGRGARLAEISVLKGVPWDIILLFGGGFALARGFVESGLSNYIGMQFQAMQGMPPLVMVFMVALIITFLTELTSNTATCEMVLPILAAVSVALRIHPLLLMVTATVSVSMAFMLPVATPPNAIVFGSKMVTVPQMARAGLLLNLIGAVLITLTVYYLSPIIFGIDLSQMPPWAVMPAGK